MSLVSTWTYEEGTDGSAIASGSNGVVATAGTPVYSAAAAIHGSMGLALSTVSTTLYNVAAASGQCSVYCKLHAAGSSPTTAWALKTSSTFHARVRFNPANGKIDFTDGSGTVIATSVTSYTLDQTVRIDVRHAYSGTTLTPTVQLFFGSNSEGTTPDETLSPTAYTLVSTPTREGVGPSVTSGMLYVDTIRQYDDITTWPTPYGGSGTAGSGTGSLSLSASTISSAGTTSSGSLSFSGNGLDSIADSAIGSLSFAGQGSGVPPGATLTGSMSLSGSATTQSPVSASGSLSFSGTSIVRAPVTTTGSLTFFSSGSGHSTIVPQLQVNFDNGTTTGFGVVQGATVSATSAHDGAKGVRLAPDGNGFATMTYTVPDQTHQWAAFRGWFRVITKTNPDNAFVDLIEIGNTLTVAPKGQFTVYTNSGDLGIDFNTTDFTVIDPAYGTNVWHLLEARVFFGDTTFNAHVRYDGTEYLHTSAATQTASNVKTLWVQYPSTVTDQTVDWDSIQFWYGDSDPGYLDAIPGLGAAASVDLEGTTNGQSPNTSSGSLGFGASTGAQARSTGTGSLSLGAASAPAARASTAGSVAFAATSIGLQGSGSTGSLSVTGSATVKAPSSGTGSLGLSGSVVAGGQGQSSALVSLVGSIAALTASTGQISLAASGTLSTSSLAVLSLAVLGASTSGAIYALVGQNWVQKPPLLHNVNGSWIQELTKII